MSSSSSTNNTEDPSSLSATAASSGCKEETKVEHAAVDILSITTTTPIPSIALPPTVVHLLQQFDADENNTSGGGGWKNDLEYFEALLACETLRYTLYQAKSNLLDTALFLTSKRHVFSWPPKQDNVNVDLSSSLANRMAPVQEQVALFQDLLVRLQDKMAQKLQATTATGTSSPPRPLVEKLLDALHATDLQRRIFRFVLVMESTRNPMDIMKRAQLIVSQDLIHRVFTCTEDSSTTTTATNTRTLTLTLRSLVDSQSIWVKESIYHAADASSKGWHKKICNMCEATLSTLLGYEITSVNQFNSMDCHLLQNVLLKDDDTDNNPFLQTPTGMAIREHKKNQEGKHTSANTIEQQQQSDKPPPSSIAAAILQQQQEKKNTMSGGNGSSKKTNILDVLSIAVQQENLDIKKKMQNEPGNHHDGENGNKDDRQSELAQPKENAATADDDDNDDNDNDDDDDDTHAFRPYKTDLEYLEDQVELVDMEGILVMLKQARKYQEKQQGAKNYLDSGGGRFGDDDFFYSQMMGGGMYDLPGRRRRPITEMQVEKAARALKKLGEKIQTKLASTCLVRGEPRLEQLCNALKLERFEKYCILYLVEQFIFPEKYTRRGIPTNFTTVGDLIQRFSDTLEKRMERRRVFYKSGTLVQEGILSITGVDFMSDLTACQVQLDRRMFDFIIGLDTEFSEIVDGSHLYVPNVNLDDVVLPLEMKKRICYAIEKFDDVKDAFQRLEVDKKMTYGLGQVMLFYGHSGTGKTMLANAIATKLKKKVLMVNFPNLGTNESGAIIKYLFREARINKALLFFDECESIFMSRDKQHGSSVAMILTELERFDDLCILATNRAYDLDEAMHRRISLAMEFKKPDHLIREDIWKTLKPPKVDIDESVNFTLLAQKYELTGGLIKNAWLQAVGLMVRREGTQITQNDLMQASSEQIVGQLSMEKFDRRVIPTCGIDAMALTPDIKESLNNILHSTKAQAVLYGQWGFDKIHQSSNGISALFTGPSGTGKTMAAAAIGFDLGRPLLVANVSELVSKWVGETGKNIESIFADAKKKDAVLVFDEAEGLFGKRSSDGGGSSTRHDTMNVGLLLQYIENFPGVCIVITNMKNAIDEAFFRRFRYVLDFALPDASTREEIWKRTLPKSCPLAMDVSFHELARRYAMSGGNIKNALLRAATTAALRPNVKGQVVTMNDLDKACAAEMEMRGNAQGGASMYA